MQRSLFPALSLALAAAAAPAQATDVGLTLDGGMLTVIYGQDCGPVGCTPFVGGPVAVAQPRNVIHYSAPQSLYAIAVGLPGACTPVPGIENALLLDFASIIIVDSGLTTSPPFVPLPCQQGIANWSLVLPAAAPIGLTFRIQSFGQSNSGAFAFGPAIETTIV